MKVGVVREAAPGETRVALVPEVVGRVQSAGHEVLVEEGAGARALWDDDAYRDAGASVHPAGELYREAEVLLQVRPPSPEALDRMRPGQTVLGMLEPLHQPELVGRLAAAGVTAVSLDMLPRTLSRAQTMDALSSQANVAGYKAVLVAAAAYGRYFPMLMTAAGTSQPARVLVLGAGVAGLQAIGTARRLGAVVTGYDIRPETRTEIESVGGRYLDLGDVAGAGGGTGGYARALTTEEQQAQRAALEARLTEFDILITTAQVPGRRPPLLVTSDGVRRLRSGSVVVDMAAGPLGGNVEGSVPDQTEVCPGGITIIGAGALPATVPMAASTAYARNITALLAHLSRDGKLVLDLADDVQVGVVITHNGAVVHPTVRDLVSAPADAEGGAS